MFAYTVEIDGFSEVIWADSLAHLANKLRDRGAKRICVWSPSGTLLIDTKYGDMYGLIKS